MHLLIPISEVREHMLPYSDLFTNYGLTEEMIYNVACYGLHRSFTENNYDLNFVNFNVENTSWEIFSESVMEFIDELDTEKGNKINANEVISKSVDAAMSAAKNIVKYIRNFDEEATRIFKERDCMLLVEDRTKHFDIEIQDGNYEKI